MLKKILSIAVVSLLILSIAGCRKKDTNNENYDLNSANDSPQETSNNTPIEEEEEGEPVMITPEEEAEYVAQNTPEALQLFDSGEIQIGSTTMDEVKEKVANIENAEFTFKEVDMSGHNDNFQPGTVVGYSCYLVDDIYQCELEIAQ